MKKSLLYAVIPIMLAGCTGLSIENIDKAPPSASANWRHIGDLSKNKSVREIYENEVRKAHDMYSCNYDPDAGGTREEDACVRKKGWYRVGYDPYPENKKYELPHQ